MSDLNAKPGWIICIALLVGLQLACGKTTPNAVTPTTTAASALSVSTLESEAPVPQSTQGDIVSPSEPAQVEIASPEPTVFETVSSYAPKPVIAPGDSNRTLLYEGLERSYLLHIPIRYDPLQPAPLVLVYHGISLDADEMVRITGMDEQADRAGFIVAYPNGTGNRQSWNGGSCCGEAVKNAVDDVGFTRTMIDDLAGLVNLDRKRIYATGFSNGAIMAYRLACDLADQIAAIAPVGAAPAVRSCQPSRPISVIHFHGDADELNPYEGGTTAGGLKFISVETGIDAWLKLNTCPNQAQETTSGNIVHRIYAPCLQDTSVELYKVLGGEHAWPGGEAVSAEVGEPTDEIDASALIWEFFSAHPMP